MRISWLDPDIEPGERYGWDGGALVVLDPDEDTLIGQYRVTVLEILASREDAIRAAHGWTLRAGQRLIILVHVGRAMDPPPPRRTGESSGTRGDTMSTYRQSTRHQTAQYKGRSYRLAWVGETKYGRRAKLQFFDGSREFWVDATAVTVAPRHDHEGGEDWRYLRDGTPGPVRGCARCRSLGRMCPDCEFDEFDC
jgi:hypothetical protein